jgi:hypothetical protein
MTLRRILVISCSCLNTPVFNSFARRRAALMIMSANSRCSGVFSALRAGDAERPLLARIGGTRPGIQTGPEFGGKCGRTIGRIPLDSKPPIASARLRD